MEDAGENFSYVNWELIMDKDTPTLNRLLLCPRMTTTTASVYHVRLGHPGADIFNGIAPIIELPKHNIDDYTVCPVCALSKSTDGFQQCN